MKTTHSGEPILPLIPLHVGRNTYTIYDCVADGFQANTELCVRSITLTTLCATTFLLCFFLLIRMTRIKQKIISYQLFVLALSMVITVVGALHFGYVGHPFLDIVLSFLKLLEYLIICYFFSSFACKLFDHQEYINKYLLPVYLLIFVYLSCSFAISCLQLVPHPYDCADPSWLLFASSQFVLGAVLTTAGLVILRKLYSHRSSIRTFRTFGRERLLFYMIVLFTLTSIVSLGFEIYVFITLNSVDKCSKFFSDTSPRHIVFLISIAIVEILVPIWAVLILFIKRRKAGLPDYSVQHFVSSGRQSDFWYRGRYSLLGTSPNRSPPTSANPSPRSSVMMSQNSS